MSTTTRITNLRARVQSFDDQLAKFSAAELVMPDTFPLYNVLIDLAKEELPDDPSVSELGHAPDHAMQAGSLRIALSQILAALPKESKRLPGEGRTDDLTEKDW